MNSKTKKYQRVGTFKSVDEFRQYVQELGLALDIDDAPLSSSEGSPLSKPLSVGGFQVGNRWCVHPMEGWDGTPCGKPTDHTTNRWIHFGQSGCKLIWGGEAFAVQREGRANPNQLFYSAENVQPMRELFNSLIDAHRERFGPHADSDLMVGLQLTHSGRFCRPDSDGKLKPKIAYHHPLLDEKAGIAASDDSVILSDDEIKRLIDDYVVSAKMAADIGFQFVDIKHCHGYLGHEFLSAYNRPGPYGGDFEGRTRFMREICQAIQAACPDLLLGVRLSLFDQPPFRPDGMTPDGKLGKGVPVTWASNYPAFGCDRDQPLSMDLTEPCRLLRYMRDELKIATVNLSAGSPYYNPHIQRPAFYPPSDGYTPPEDPLVGCMRQIDAVKKIKAEISDLPIVGTAYSYFQDFLPHVAQPLVRQNAVDFIGIGRLVLSYWDLPADVLEGFGIRRPKKICRTFSDCTTGPRNGLVSGCYPLDDRYKKSSEHQQLKQIKKQQRAANLSSKS